MRGIFFITVFLFSRLVFPQAAEKEIRFVVPQSGSEIGKWEKLELGIRLPQPFREKVEAFVSGKNAPARINPFDPEQINIEAVFSHLSDSDTSLADYTRTINGFYYNEFTRSTTRSDDAAWIRQSDPYTFRVRFAPGMTGRWICHLQLKTGNETLPLGKLRFTCKTSSSKGPVVKNNYTDERGRYLQYAETGEMFFAEGMNLPWTHLDEMHAGGFNIYTSWFDHIAANGGNYVQLSMLPFTYGIEWEDLGNYSTRMKNAWELDRLVDMAHEKKIFINMLMIIHDEMMSNTGWTHKNNNWKNNAYNTAKNNGRTQAAGQLDFFTDPAAIKAFKNRLRYIMARYGYSVNIPILELLSEIDNAVPGYDDQSSEGKNIRMAVKNWFAVIHTYVKEELGYSEKLIGGSYAQGAQVRNLPEGVFGVTDITLLHFYGRDKYTNYNQRSEHAEKLLNSAEARNKPVIFDEMGAAVFPALDKCSDITFHNNLWATAFMGCFGSGQNWWWENALIINGYEKNLAGIKRFMQDEDFTKTVYVIEKWINTMRFNKGTDYEAYYLKAADGTKAVGWVHNTSFWWANLKNHNECIADLVNKNNGSSIDQADNTTYGKEYARNKATGTPETKKGYTFKIKMPLKRTDYIVKWYNTLTGEPTGQTQQVTSSGSGKIKIDIPEITYPENPFGGLGFKIVKYSR